MTWRYPEGHRHVVAGSVDRGGYWPIHTARNASTATRAKNSVYNLAQIFILSMLINR